MLNKLMGSFALGKLTLKNRIVFPPITTALATRTGEVTDNMLAYYRKRAEGGAGLIIVEPGIISAEGNLVFRSLAIHQDENVVGLTRLAEVIKQAGARAFIQLAHVGPKGHIKINGEVPLGASAVEVVRGQLPRAMSLNEIAAIKQKFVAAAERASQAGFEGVELHGAHFYLLSAFLSPYTNQREDQYGGTTQGRCLLLKEIIIAIKARLGQDFPVICRIHGAELLNPGIDLQEAKAVALELEQAGVDALHISAYDLALPEGGFYTIAATCIPGAEHQPGVFVELASAIKATVKMPVIAVGKIDSAELAESVIAEGKADLVAIGRQLVADAETISKWLEGREYVSCTNCNRCLASIGRKAISCAVNQELY